FVDLYNKGLLYRDYRMINWDTVAKTVLSNEEVIRGDENAQLSYIEYRFADGSNGGITIATQRPETIMADVAVAVNPKDERFTDLIGKKVLVPLINRPIPIIADNHVDIEFGTGALKITPAHSPEDYVIGKKHHLPVINILNEDGTINEEGQILVGEDRFVARKKINKMLAESGHLLKLENYKTNIGRSERTNSIVEPRLSLQWYVNMKKLGEKALEAVMTDEVQFFPANFKNTYRHWLENIQDWCISRQLWWGHRIPAWYLGEDTFVAATAEEALAKAKEKTGNPSLTLDDLRQDDDALDTWFSSWLWPISVFDGFNDSKDFNYYYPTNVLVTGWDIIFLWVARMIMAGYEWYDERPFEKVYFTGMVRDKQRRKMSKSLGNSPDALKLIEKFGADGVRYGMLSSSPAGGDLLFDEKLCEQGSKFSNKIWNALNLVKGLRVSDTQEQPEINQMAVRWFEQKFNKILAEMDKDFDQFRLSESLVKLYSFIWGDFCSWYLEMIKPAFGQPIDKVTYDATIDIFSRLMTVLHPFMPFLTEEVWHQLKERQEGEDCVVSVWPKGGKYNLDFLNKVALSQDIVSKIRDIRNKNGVKWAEKLPLLAQKSKETEQLLAEKGIQGLLTKLGNLESIQLVEKEPQGNTVSFIVSTGKYYVPLTQDIDVAAEIKKSEEELKRMKGFVLGIEKKLSNERFVANAPEKVVAMERKKLADGQARIAILEETLTKLKG
ncbi:MAG TPA: valine--tRNA ligase, partial [Saprospiraceae bacterium]|nr:valine--tRNA ligase [Saprospiraceae bacterium]